MLALSGCKSRKSHVVITSSDSLDVNREVSTLDVKATAYKVENSSNSTDSTWQLGIRLQNFNGIIYTNGQIEGQAETIDLKSQGSKQSQSQQTKESKDSIVIAQADELEQLVKVNKKEEDRQKEVEGNTLPWYLKVVVFVAFLYLLYIVYKQIKNKLKPF